MKIQYKNSFLNPDYSFDNYILNRSSQRIVEDIKLRLSSKRNKRNPIFLHGAYGIGKTHLLQAIAKKYKAKYFTCEQFVNCILTAIYRHKYDKFSHEICERSEILIIDDIHFLKDRLATMIEVMHVLRRLHGQGKIAIISSDRPAQGLFYVNEDNLYSFRFKTYELTPLSHGMCARYVQRKAQKLNIDLKSVTKRLYDIYPVNLRWIDSLINTVLLRRRIS